MTARARRSADGPLTVGDRLAMCLGCGVIGLLSGFAIGLLLFALTQGTFVLFGGTAVRSTFLYLPCATGAVAAVLGALSPRAAEAFLGRVFAVMGKLIEWFRWW